MTMAVNWESSQITLLPAGGAKLARCSSIHCHRSRAISGCMALPLLCYRLWWRPGPRGSATTVGGSRLVLLHQLDQHAVRGARMDERHAPLGALPGRAVDQLHPLGGELGEAGLEVVDLEEIGRASCR